jgi:uncharacterized pyridoxal phosphate-containing UPF0001 family protein
LAAVAGYVSKCEHLKFAGLMTLPPFFEDVELGAAFLSQACGLRDQLADQGMFPNSRGELSMGMTHDFEVAIEEGATIVRIEPRYSVSEVKQNNADY